MRYSFFLTYLFFAWLSGQSAVSQPRLMYGPKVGITYAGWDHENYAILDTRDFYQKVPGFTAGAFARYRLHGRWLLTAELLYGYSGSRQRNVTRGTSQLVNGPFRREERTTLYFGSLQTPLYVSYEWGRGKIRPVLHLGAAPAFVIHGRRTEYEYSSLTGEKASQSRSLVVGRFPYESQRNHVQVLGGAGISINGQWLIGLQYNINPNGYGYLYREAAVSSVPDPLWDGIIPGGISYHDRAFTLSVAVSLASRKAL
jgi:hypothetical protein